LSCYGKPRGFRFPSKRPILYYITDRQQLSRGRLLQAIRRAIALGIDFVQIREKDLPDGELFTLVLRTVSLVARTRCRVLVNGRADIALAAGAHGVHLPSSGLLPNDLRAWVPRGFLIGMSAHSPRDAARAAAHGADYVLLGPVYATPSKMKYGPPLGLDCLRRACSERGVPVLGLGGITRDRIPEVLDAGAAGIAGITLFQKPEHSARP
jgi:thiamine-phosphate pyrophosphorylase